MLKFYSYFCDVLNNYSFFNILLTSAKRLWSENTSEFYRHRVQVTPTAVQTTG